MDYEILTSKIFAETKKGEYDEEVWQDLVDACKGWISAEGQSKGVAKLMEYREYITSNMSKLTKEESAKAMKMHLVYKKILLALAPYHFDSYMIYLEINRRATERFYTNRRKHLKPIVDALQELADNKLDELFLSQPPRTGKTTLILFYVSWLIGRNTEYPNLYSSFSDLITKAFYNGLLEIITDEDTYLWKEVFPGVEIARTNAQDETLDLGRKKHYPTLTCRSLYGTLNGACDAEKGVIISDDLIGGIEEALNKDRLMSAWAKVDNNLIPRGKGGTKYLWIGTRWSIYDPAGLRQELLMNDPKFVNHRYKIINIPALNENDESNFDYANGVGFNTLYYQQRRASFERNNDMASWFAQYMGEPIERDGALFTPDTMLYYNGELPEGKADRIFMAVDPAFGGGDYVASPVIAQYGDELYVMDVIYNNGDKKITQPLIANVIIKYGVGSCQFEANKSTESYKEGVEKILKDKGYRVNLTTKPAPTNKGKNERIFETAPDIRETMYFLEPSKRSKDYGLFMTNVFNFKMFGKNDHDDAPDSLSMAIDMVHKTAKKIEVFKRPF